MKSTLSKIVIFSVGAAIGSAVTYKIVKNRYEQIAKEEIESVKEVFSRRRDYKNDIEPEKETEECRAEHNEEDSVTKELKEALNDIAHSEGYVNYSELIHGGKKSEVKQVKKWTKKPYVIPPEEFDELDGYEAISLTYFADGVLTDDYNEPVEDVEGTVGLASLETFGQYEDDSVFVRNEELMTDYEILADMRNYSDIIKDDADNSEES